jgi:hypothetical protein
MRSVPNFNFNKHGQLPDMREENVNPSEHNRIWNQLRSVGLYMFIPYTCHVQFPTVLHNLNRFDTNIKLK